MLKNQFVFWSIVFFLSMSFGQPEKTSLSKQQEAAIKNYILSQEGGSRLLAQESLSDKDVTEALQKVLRLIPMTEMAYSQKKRANEQYLASMNYQIDSMKRTIEEFQNTDVVYKEADFKKNLESRLKRTCCMAMQRATQKRSGGAEPVEAEDIY